MGRQKRTDTINYCILFLHNKKTNTRLLDLTPTTNVRNYKYMLKQSYEDKTKKHLDYNESKCVKVPLETIKVDNDVVDCETQEIVV